jgi:phosphate transport system substrate-binding protein
MKDLADLALMKQPAFRSAKSQSTTPLSSSVNAVLPHFRCSVEPRDTVWTDYLSKISPEWKTQVGTSLAPKWPVGLEANGNDGVSKLVKERAGSIGYVEFIYALQNHLTYGRVRNRDGKFVSANLESIAAAANHSMKISRDFKVSVVDAPGAEAYPISSFTWIVVPIHTANEATKTALTGFLHWMLGAGQRQAAALGYLPLPKDVVIKEEAAIARIQ